MKIAATPNDAVVIKSSSRLISRTVGNSASNECRPLLVADRDTAS
jgi:hypothetical protein